MNDTIKFITDTICHTVQLNHKVLLVPQNGSDNLLRDFIAILTLILSFLAFAYELYKTRKANRQYLESTWYLKVIVEPNMDMINKFYQDIILECDKSVSTLFSDYENNMPTKEFKTKNATLKRKIKDEIKNSLDHFTTLLNVSEPGVTKKINNQLDQLVDIVTSNIDNYENWNNEMSSKSQILGNKQGFISILYQTWSK